MKILLAALFSLNATLAFSQSVSMNCSTSIPEAELMQPLGSAYALTYKADRQLLISSGESCLFVVQNAAGETQNYVAALDEFETVEEGKIYKAELFTDETVMPGFRIQYEEFGGYLAYFDPHKKIIFFLHLH